MRSRYVAYKLEIPKYIISTTHTNNIDFNTNTTQWEQDIIDFCKNCDFKDLIILDFLDDSIESYVTFKVNLFCNFKDNSFTEKSKFLKKNGKWYYFSGKFL